MVNTSYFVLTNKVIEILIGDSTDGYVHLDELDYAVVDGVPVSEEFPDHAVFVGWSGDPDGDYQAAGLAQDWAATGGSRRRDEQVDLVCAVTSLYGNADSWKPARDNGLAILADIETKIRDNPELGLVPDTVRQVISAEFKPAGVHQEPYSDTGFWFRCPFTISVKTRI